jgi:hypothetical protein
MANSGSIPAETARDEPRAPKRMRLPEPEKSVPMPKWVIVSEPAVQSQVPSPPTAAVFDPLVAGVGGFVAGLVAGGSGIGRVEADVEVAVGGAGHEARGVADVGPVVVLEEQVEQLGRGSSGHGHDGVSGR